MGVNKLRKPRVVIGPRLRFRDASEDDAAFILGLRTDHEKGRYLSATSPRLEDRKTGCDATPTMIRRSIS